MANIFDRYHAAWEAQDPDQIAALHADDATFWMHDGTPAVQGRAALRGRFGALFARFPRMSFDTHRREFGQAHWVLDYTMVLQLTDPSGAPFEARVKMLDVVNVNDAGQVTRKDVYLNGAEAYAAYARAGMAP
ncbi:MAG: nuclear transport factor 2 family protein [Terricaulis sp.]